jgi:hypothetical protein
MRKFLMRKRVLLAVGAALALSAAGGAYAYFSATGSGSGSASVGSASAVAISGTTAGDLYPDGAASEVAITVSNPGDGTQHVGSVQLASISGPEGCDTSLSGAKPAFAMADVAVDADLVAGASKDVVGSLQMNDTGVSQDACQGGSLTLHFTSN